MKKYTNPKKEYKKGLSLIYSLIGQVFPLVRAELGYWHDFCGKMEDRELSHQASASIEMKRFHAQGGGAYALYPGTPREETVRFIVALQTISDYLDNLCDRAGVQDEASFRQLHLAMLDAVSLQGMTEDYYRLYPYKKDSGYLNQLVEACRGQILRIPAYPSVAGYIENYAGLYSDLQACKHLSPGIREARMKEWTDEHMARYPEISPWEFSAATGSTLGMFVLAAAAFDPALGKEEIEKLDAAYFPWIGGLHILLDYYIDLQEDAEHKDLNFVQYYHGMEECEERLGFFIRRALASCEKLPYPEFHRTIVQGLLAMYLSDPKALEGHNRAVSMRLLKRGGLKTQLYFVLCRKLRASGKL